MAARVRVVCYDVSSSGYCSGKTSGNSYSVTGTGTEGDANSDVTASTAAVAAVNGLATDPSGNVILFDRYKKVRIVCSTVAAGYCSGKNAGNIYTLAGNGGSSETPSNSVGSASELGIPYAGALSANSAGDLVIAGSAGYGYDGTVRLILNH